MKQSIYDAASNSLFLALTGLGITLAPHEFFGGVVFALAAASLNRQPDGKTLAQVLFAALVLAVAAAIITSRLLPEYPAQIITGATGFFSQGIIRMLQRVGVLVESRADTITDRVIDRVLPATGPAQSQPASPPTVTPTGQKPETEEGG